ncbi:bifunctional 5-dehydro-2-deoxygluconokinase/5-dehydro-2-deoxyphosphogluconate aldolase [Steroidobacter agaridevorans]|uniref:bifunctional 5-dehydro-2-deoxygluconokinase/5-dehydro-2- deoxyphosphogluconate aldolase n=1 Tax=Steroidobacter agaridevorans TaxID=2695856 RepID=UPI00132C0717|nr:5-dehydro-2-deoxygluconokinase [Steroidobacter agaridevorans]GFE85939.1 5-dehydro-2-deoxygluconokinase [Steroidobacter agaridevorans]
MNKTFDLICLGRAAVDFYGEQIGGRLEDMRSFAKYLGGSSANLAAGTSRLGLRVSMLTRVGDEHMGRFVREALQREGVDVSHVATDPTRLTASVVLGIEGPAAYPHIFFRENCADMGVCAQDFDESYIAGSRAVAVTGTHLSTPGTRAAVEQAFRWARANRTRVILDIDYRPVLWKLTNAGQGESRFIESAEVTQALQRVLPDCDLVVGTEEEIRIAGGSDDVLASLRAIRRKTHATIVLKRGPAGCSVITDEVPATLAELHTIAGFPVEVLNVLGAGDAFLSGFLSGWLRGRPLAECARLGNACGALVVSRHGCTPAMPSALELQEFLRRAASVRRPDLDAELSHVHEATTTRRPRESLYVLAFDHRRQLEELADEHGASRARIGEFKDLIARAVERVAAGTRDREHLGVIVDARHGSAVLNRLTTQGFWIGRPIETPGSRPVAFDPPDNVGLHLTSWPVAHVIKCLVFFHPDDPIELRLAQERQIRTLNDAARAQDRELLLEIICSGRGLPVDDATTARALTRIYNLGVRPAWWKLEAQSRAAWLNIAEVIERRDPHCNGVLMLGLDAPEEALQASFESAAAIPVCKGFAVGRSIFNPAARGWFAGALSDEQVVADIADRYQRLIDSWRALRASHARLSSRVSDALAEQSL